MEAAAGNNISFWQGIIPTRGDLPAGWGPMIREAYMSQPSRRFVLPYEPEYAAHRTDRRIERAMQLHRLARRHVMSPSLVPNASAADGGATRHDRTLEPQRSGFPDKN